MWIKVIDNSVTPAVSITLGEDFLTDCNYRKPANRKAMIACSRPIKPDTETIEQRTEYIFGVPEVDIEMYSGESLLKTVKGCFFALHILEGSGTNPTIERLELLVGYKNVDGEIISTLTK